ncbi:RGG repeats nuclear RNA binding protein A-like isoform X2 [Cucurbita maxima]|uniref:RGG repeats nuclear RNA binding protein A-like isoform X2 n=1 Tax=Cucurbita maxima TaxID=3661 RepID=A0A6J1I9W0_CUCMA|nr:RGG repeats nuclear RNA binding protein A-like isoform X2 [Cucurbita maxima]
MATVNPFDLLGDDDAEDPSQLIAAKQVAAVTAPPPKEGSAQTKPVVPASQQNKPASLPSKPLPPSQAVREARNEGIRGGRGSGRGGGRGYGRGREGGGFNRDFANSENTSAPEDGEAGKTTERRGYGGPRGRGGRRGGFNNGEVGDGERPRRVFERHSGTGRGNEYKREGAGRGNWGRPADEFAEVAEEAVNEPEKNVGDEKPVQEEDTSGVNTENPAKEPEETEPEDKEMTLEEYEKLLEDKRKALMALKTEERKVDPKEFASMQQLSSKKENNDIFIKLGSEKDKRKEIADKEERTKKSLSINEFLRPAERERQYTPGGRVRGRGRGSRGGYGGSSISNVAAPSIEDPGQFPTLGAK